MADGKVPQGERYVQLNILNMFTKKGGNSSSSIGNSNRGSSAGRGGPIRNRPSTLHRYSATSGMRGSRDKEREGENPKTEPERERGLEKENSFNSTGASTSGEWPANDSGDEVEDIYVPPQGTSKMLRAAGGTAAATSKVNNSHAKIVTKECAMFSRAIFKHDTTGYVYNALDIKPLGAHYCPRYRLPPGDSHEGTYGTRIRVYNRDTFACAETLIKRHNFEQSQMEIAREQGNTEPDIYPTDTGVVVLNMANKDVKGGGFINGAIAQEEFLMHRSTLWCTLPGSFYPMSDTEAVYSPYVVIYKKLLDKPRLEIDNPASYIYLERAQAIYDACQKGERIRNGNQADLPGPPLPELAIISMAAIKGPKLTKSNKYSVPNEKALMEIKIRQMLRMAALNGHRRLVLGAFGCGVFGNPPEEVAQMFLDIFQEPEFQGGWWKEIIFACLSSKANTNYAVFDKILGGQIV
ncbi:hypothetical protein ABW19_dt0208115 [Dactylella cylindrospora]|nr:hypothetical protein ABW19_dt0208115 [Dactylella cylindrospora]